MPEVRKKGGLSPETVSLRGQTKAYVSRLLAESGYSPLIHDRHLDTAAGHYLFAKACLQSKAAATYKRDGDAAFAQKLQRSALVHVHLALHFAPSVVKEALGEIPQGDIRYPFHAARRFGISLAEQELQARGPKGYDRPMTRRLEHQVAKALAKEIRDSGQRRAA